MQELQSSPSLSIQRVQAQVSALVSKQIGHEVAPDAPLMEAGLDSLGAMELRTALGSSFGAELPATIIFDHPSIAALASYVSRISQQEAAPSSLVGPDHGCSQYTRSLQPSERLKFAYSVLVKHKAAA